MTNPRSLLIALLATAACTLPAAAQGTTPPGFREEILQQLEASTGKLMALAEAMPADRFAWGPTADVMPVGQVYMHIAAYNYHYPSRIGVEIPAGVDVKTMESIREKEVVVDQLKRSVEHALRAVRETTDAELGAPTRLYGRDVAHWAVLLQLLAHMNEHLGQSISYARVAGVVPPWSR